MILSDGAIGQMMEKVELSDYVPRLTDEEVIEKYGSWATHGKPEKRDHNIITSLNLQPEPQEEHNNHLQRKYKKIEKEEIRYEKLHCEDAEYVFVAYGSSSRICQKAIQLGREKGLKLGMIRPITLFPYPSKIIKKASKKAKAFLAVEMSAGQMVEDVRLAVNGKVPVEHYGRYGGMVPMPDEILEAMEKLIKKVEKKAKKNKKNKKKGKK